MLTHIQNHLQTLQEKLTPLAFRTGQRLYLNGQCQILSQGQERFSFLVDDEFGDYELRLEIHEDLLTTDTKSKKETEAYHVVGCLLQLADEFRRVEPREIPAGKAYTRDGMIRRVLAERMDKALKAEYRVRFANNPYGEHVLTNEKGMRYKLTFHDVEQETGYCSCLDYRANKLGTCKHLMFAYLKKKRQ